MSAKKRAVFSLYRSFRREIARLPTEYLRQFFRLKVGDDVRAILDTNHGRLQATKTKRVEKELRKLRDANAGRVKPFNHILDVAYGRIGKLRWEIMKPLLSDLKAPLPDRIIPQERNRDLLRLATPPKLPNRADPTSEEARLLGPFSKRRQVNIRWRYFTQEWKKLYPPLQVTLKEETSSGEVDGQPTKTRCSPVSAELVDLKEEAARKEAKKQMRQLRLNTSDNRYS
ncbi:hypothetical protein A0H81_00776 [Grifola frondosa]|uniref:LYR motif-containing protein Cup1-like N-terminal domain-containing protein n=1 Tax=Grifola frondosa TaxID=5627 RepID=A0A1C7MR02_GRIFR|nr:hypothetical protein A0H81_00776 [Grifola frondosa]